MANASTTASVGTPDNSRGNKLIVILPALNEGRTIADVISSIPRQLPGILEVRAIVVDDGSSDNTVKQAEAVGALVVRHGQNLGVGAAFQTGLREALRQGADIIVNIDADGQFNANDIPLLIAPIQRGRAAFVTASRFGLADYRPEMPTIKRLGNQWMVRIINFLTKRNFTDVSCGFRAYSREAALRLTLFGSFTYTQETFIDLAFKNIVMAEVPVRARGEREFGTSRVANNIWRYGIKTATIIFRTARDYRPQYFFGLPGLVIFLSGVASGVFLLVHFLRSGQTYPYRSLVQVAGVLIIVGFLLIFLSMLADMMQRNRMIIEEAVYLARRRAYDSEK